MNALLDRLNLQAQERRLLFVFLIVLFIVINRFFVWPHFARLADERDLRDEATRRLQLYQLETNRIPMLQEQLELLGESAGPQASDNAQQRTRIGRTIDQLVTETGLTLSRRSTIRELRPEFGQTNQFFTELEIPYTFEGTEAQLVEFLYRLGDADSLYRVHNLNLQPARSGGLNLEARITLVASFIKNSEAAEGSPNSQ